MLVGKVELRLPDGMEVALEIRTVVEAVAQQTCAQLLEISVQGK
jgi:hypothetical protein